MEKIDHLADFEIPRDSFDRDSFAMNYVLQVVRGRSTTATLKLAPGVTTVGRHDDCLIRVKSSQVSRRHCEFFEASGNLNVRDLGSSNGTFVNGKRISGAKEIHPGDELTVGSITLRVATLGAPGSSPGVTPRPSKAGDTAIVEAVPISAGDDAEFELEFDDDEPVIELDVIPLAGADAPTASPTPTPKAAKSPAKEAAPAKDQAPGPKKPAEEDEAIGQFLLDLKLDED